MKSTESSAVRVSRDGAVTCRDDGQVVGYLLRSKGHHWEARRPGGFVAARGRTRREALAGLIEHVYGPPSERITSPGTGGTR